MKNLNPVLNDGVYIFFCFTHNTHPKIHNPVMVFREFEGKTMIIEKQQADEFEIPYQEVFSWITLAVFSSLETVGLTAKFSKELAIEEIRCNVVAGFHHDHIFVPLEQADKAMEILKTL
jgi:uncharacterized protein